MADPADARAPARRGWLKALLGAAAGGLGLSVLYPVLCFMAPPARPDASVNRVLAGKRSELSPGSGKVFRFGSRPAILIATSSGEVLAFSAACTHLSCTVHYRPDLRRIGCACHGGLYDLEGVPVAGPPPRPLERFHVAFRGDEIWVSRGA
jgi:cytochrome b6-f complex iron-sulfur subunit